jgi:hypothetical protein
MDRRSVVLVLALLLIGCAHSSGTAGTCSAQTVQQPSFTPAVSLLRLHGKHCCCSSSSETTTWNCQTCCGSLQEFRCTCNDSACNSKLSSCIRCLAAVVSKRQQ